MDGAYELEAAGGMNVVRAHLHRSCVFGLVMLCFVDAAQPYRYYRMSRPPLEQDMATAQAVTTIN